MLSAIETRWMFVMANGAQKVTSKMTQHVDCLIDQHPSGSVVRWLVSRTCPSQEKRQWWFLSWSQRIFIEYIWICYRCSSSISHLLQLLSQTVHNFHPQTQPCSKPLVAAVFQASKQSKLSQSAGSVLWNPCWRSRAKMVSEQKRRINSSLDVGMDLQIWSNFSSTPH